MQCFEEKKSFIPYLIYQIIQNINAQNINNNIHSPVINNIKVNDIIRINSTINQPNIDLINISVNASNDNTKNEKKEI